MRRTMYLTTAILLMAGTLGCGKDRPTSFQDAIFRRWVPSGGNTTFVEITLTRGATSAVGTYAARVMVENPDPNAMGQIQADESGTVAVSGNVLVTTSSAGMARRFTWSVEGSVLTLWREDLEAEVYRGG